MKRFILSTLALLALACYADANGYGNRNIVRSFSRSYSNYCAPAAIYSQPVYAAQVVVAAPVYSVAPVYAIQAAPVCAPVYQQPVCQVQQQPVYPQQLPAEVPPAVPAQLPAYTAQIFQQQVYAQPVYAPAYSYGAAFNVGHSYGYGASRAVFNRNIGYGGIGRSAVVVRGRGVGRVDVVGGGGAVVVQQQRGLFGRSSTVVAGGGATVVQQNRGLFGLRSSTTVVSSGGGGAAIVRSRGFRR